MKTLVYIVFENRDGEEIPVLAHTDRYEAKFYAADKEHETGIEHTYRVGTLEWE